MAAFEDKPIEIDVNDLTEELFEETGVEPEVEETPVEEPIAPTEKPAEEQQEKPAEEQQEKPAEEQQEEPAEEAEPVEEPKNRPKGKVGPLSATIRLQRENRQLRRRLVELEAARQIQTQAPKEEDQAEPSPLENWAQKNAEALAQDPDLPVPAKVQLEERKWQQDYTQRQTARATVRQEATDRATSIAQAKARYDSSQVGDVLSFDSIVAAGLSLLTPEDVRDINAVPGRAGEKSYRLCLNRLRESDPQVRKEINDALRARRQSPGKPQSVTKPIKSVQTREQILKKRPNRDVFGLYARPAG